MTVILKMANELKKASRENNAPIWAKLADYAIKPSIARRHININRIDQLTKDSAVVAFPGKVLGTGNISHKITLFSFSISNTAASKIKNAGGNIINYKELIKNNPTGKGVILLG